MFGRCSKGIFMNSQSDNEKHMTEQDIRREEKKRLIIESALKAYSKYGLEGTKIKDISDIAGIGKSTVYEYFDSKEDIEKATINYFLFQTSMSYAEMYKMIENDPVTSLINIMENMFDMPINNPELYDFYAQWLLKSTKNGKESLKREVEPLINNAMIPIKLILQSGIDKKLMSDDIDPYTFALLIGSILDGLGFAFMVFDDEKTRFELKENAKELILRRLGIEYKKEEYRK